MILMIMAFNKPFGVVMGAGTAGASRAARVAWKLPLRVERVGDLAADTEGLVVFTDEPDVRQLAAERMQAGVQVYWLQVEGVFTERGVERLQRGATRLGRGVPPSRAWLLATDPDVGLLRNGGGGG
ncbi:MAG: hypothetical protein JXQ71_09170, partial [Verrucomicrobia bacterium]|nr:hypothetical protein [Verrucomicrobiota bacterium]